MARGFSQAPSSSAEALEAQRVDLEKSAMLVLASSRHSAVRSLLGARTDCPLGLMVSLAHDYSADVRIAVASNPAAQRSILAYLASDRHTDVVLAVAANPSLAGDLLEELAVHRKADVRRAAVAARESRQAGDAGQDGEDARTPEIAEQPGAGRTAVDSWPTLPPAGAERVPVTPMPRDDGSTQRPPEPVGAFAIDAAAMAAPVGRTAPVRGFKPRAT